MSEEFRPDRLRRLSEKARALPKVPGVYLMKDAAGTVLYVGKASCLPDRVSSYFVPSADLGARKQPMLDVVEDFEILECEAEWEALLLESRLVKDIHPRFNELLRDDKRFPYLVVTVRDEFPAVYVTRNPADERYRGARVFGPFTSVHALRTAVTLMQRVFRFRTCELDIKADDPANRRFRPCLLHSIGQCTAPCANHVGKQKYREDIDRFLRFLGSKRSTMIREMEAEMAKASTERRFEDAAVLRDQITSIGRLPECEVTLLDPNVSRRHAEIHQRGNGFVIVDLGSTNGCTVNGVRVTERELRDGDEIGIGNLRLSFQAS